MGGTTGISWTDSTWVPLTGCTRISPGCDACYAYKLHDQRHVAWKRGRYDSAAEQYHEPFSTLQLLPERLEDPLNWRRPRKVFLTSMGDLFHEEVPNAYLDSLFATMAVCEEHTFQALTKRPKRMHEYLTQHAFESRPTVRCLELELDGRLRNGDACHVCGGPNGQEYRWPLPNVWLGTSVEDQERARDRLLWLLETPAAVHWISAEPLLGPLDLTAITLVEPEPPYGPGVYLNALKGHVLGPDDMLSARTNWVVIGGESGPRYREMDLHWLESVVQQCRDAGVAVWTKQDSGRLPGKQGRIPDELWIHEWPEPAP